MVGCTAAWIAWSLQLGALCQMGEGKMPVPDGGTGDARLVESGSSSYSLYVYDVRRLHGIDGCRLGLMEGERISRTEVGLPRGLPCGGWERQSENA